MCCARSFTINTKLQFNYNLQVYVYVLVCHSDYWLVAVFDKRGPSVTQEAMADYDCTREQRREGTEGLRMNIHS